MGWFIKGGLSIGFFMSNMTSEVPLVSSLITYIIGFS